MKAVSGSGRTSMSDSWMLFQPRMLEPSKPSPSSKVPALIVWAGTEKCCQAPKKSQKRMSTILTPFLRMRSSTWPGPGEGRPSRGEAGTGALAAAPPRPCDCPAERPPLDFDIDEPPLPISNPPVRTLDRLGPALARADADHVPQLVHVHASAAALGPPAGGADRFDGRADEALVHRDFEAHARARLEIAPRSPLEPRDVGHREPEHLDPAQRLLHVAQALGRHDGLDHLHGWASNVVTDGTRARICGRGIVDRPRDRIVRGPPTKNGSAVENPDGGAGFASCVPSPPRPTLPLNPWTPSPPPPRRLRPIPPRAS